MAPQALTGILVALVTPFKADGSIDYANLNKHVNRMIDLGVHGIVPGGSSGEFTTLSFDERKSLIEAVIKAADGRVPVVAGVGALSTPDGIELATHHAKAGASALMVLPPFYEAPNLDELKEYFKAIHEASKLPLLYYNIPSITGTNLEPQQLASLSEVGVKYLKDTSGNAPALTELLLGQDKITAFNGWDTLTFYGLAAGAKGSVWGATNVIPELSVELWNAIGVENDLVKGPLKLGMDIRGWSAGDVRKPFVAVASEHRNELAMLLKNAGVKTV
ncbi:hypothetical protein AU210_012193 [Fusarium oxysporum f. sp. radicis-cucumerinum]|uniref:Dihydrodipicolinate synthase n=1 Tax=Fusarium oxysporum f. sp. radicis-cucumerinum TaxID=327505 RepID=A0A2H3GZL9_FUSOX|nr:hypothetical protein AU210_012193 [Fusarium oxysporum f. sp. radicis-cucumerinum]